MPKMKAVVVSAPGGPLEIVERDVPEPGAGWVRLRVEACGICHGDTLVREGHFPGLGYPRVPGHEVAGVIDAVGPEVAGWSLGQRVGVGWYAGSCGYCRMCRRGQFSACQTGMRVTGITQDGGYAGYMIVSAGALALLPEGLSPVEAAPLMCAGLTTFNALRHSAAGPGELVAVLGLGGLGHLGVQYAVKMGFRTVAIARGQDKEPLARRLGAWHYIDSTAQDPAAELQKMGGAKVILAAVTNSDAMSAAMGGLGAGGTMMVVGAGGPFPVSPIALLSGRRSVKGWNAGTSADAEDCLNFSVLTGVRSINEVFPLERAGEAFDHMLRGQARFRAVLKMGE
jgi:D-arabinose 1-dehydrogenase-like Zn-dependent alcohol dehydrogenase